jgi:hypothetical protein
MRRGFITASTNTGKTVLKSLAADTLYDEATQHQSWLRWGKEHCHNGTPERLSGWDTGWLIKVPGLVSCQQSAY